MATPQPQPEPRSDATQPPPPALAQAQQPATTWTTAPLPQPPLQSPAGAVASVAVKPADPDADPDPEPELDPDPTASTDSTKPPNDAAAEDDDRALSSPPPAPRPAAPVPGPRAARLQGILGESLRRTLARLDWDNFAACYPTIAQGAPSTLRAVQSQMVRRLEDLCKKEFDAILVNRDVVAKLNELEILIGEAGRRRDQSLGNNSTPPTPPHLLPPITVLRAHLAPHLAAHHSQLNARLQTTQALNAQLRADIARQRAESETLLSAVEAACADIDAANDALGGTLVDGLAAESRAVDAEMAGT